MTLAIRWSHEAGENARHWPHEAGDWQMLRALAKRPASEEAAVGEAIDVFASNANDIPFSAIALWDDAKGRLVVAGRSAPLAGSARLGDVLAQAFEEGRPRRRDDIGSVLGVEPIGPWGDPSSSAYVVPLHRTAPGGTRGVVLFGISPRLHFDAEYERFLESAASVFADARERAVLVERERAARREAELQ